MTPTARTLKHLRADGWLAEVVEKWIPGANVRKDLFSFIDVMAIRDDQTLAVQVTSGSNVAARIKKIEGLDTLGAVRKAGWAIHVHGWRKNSKGRYVLRVVDIS